jgi:hypothetical protein
MSDIEGKAAMVAASECGQRASFNYEVETREAGKSFYFLITSASSNHD